MQSLCGKVTVHVGDNVLWLGVFFYYNTLLVVEAIALNVHLNLR